MTLEVDSWPQGGSDVLGAGHRGKGTSFHIFHSLLGAENLGKREVTTRHSLLITQEEAETWRWQALPRVTLQV